MSRGSSRSKATTEPDGNPITGESSKEIWRRWSLEQAERDRTERHRVKAMQQAETEEGIYALEIARDVAQRHAQTAPPEWRFLKDLIGSEFGRILRQQPEIRDVQSRERLYAAIAEALPKHMRGAAWEFKTMMERFTMARESTAFLIGFEIGRESGHRAALRDPRIQLAPMADRRLLPERAIAPQGRIPLRLQDGGVR